VETTKKGNAKANHWIYEMHINEIMKKWPEKKKRERRWVNSVTSFLDAISSWISN
jgi:hypothetical protein